jgi:hypothetical protein
MSTLTLRNLQGITTYSNTILVPSSHYLQVDGGLRIPVYTTATLPSTGTVTGQLVYDSTTKTVKVWDGTTWTNVSKGFGTGTLADPFTGTGYSVSTSGTYYFKTANMTSATQYYVDASTSGGPWIRIWLSNTDNYNATSFAWSDGGSDNTQTPLLIDDCTRFMYAIVNTTTNATSQAWSWYFTNGKAETNYASFRQPPLGHGGVGAPLITAINTTQLSSNTTYTGYYLRTGISSFGSYCDDGRGGTWGQICLKNSTSSAAGSGATPGGLSDFPHFSGFSWSGTDNICRSDQGYTAGTVSSTQRFGIYVRL